MTKTLGRLKTAFWKSGNRFAGWYTKLAAFNVETLFVRKREPGPPRTIYVNENLPEGFRDQKGKVTKDHVYVTNQVITSRYTVLTFIPRNLLEQFRRIANIFFLAIAILQLFPKFSTISPGLVFLPLLIVLAITAIKDGSEDVRRHQSDRRVNHTTVRVLSGGDWINPNAMKSKSRTFVKGIRFPGRTRAKKVIPDQEAQGERLEGITMDGVLQDDREYDDEEVNSPPSTSLDRSHPATRPHWNKTLWEDLRVGDFIKIMNNEPIPADILICATSEDENVAFVETKNLDGETNLKSRNACPPLTHLRSAAHCATKLNTFRVDCGRPDTNMYRLDGAVKVGEKTFPVDMQMMLLRGTVLRNTGWVIGVVMYTGEDTRIVMNSGGTPSKWSKVEKQMNPQVFINLIILAMMAVACAIADSVLEKKFYPLGALWLYDDDQSDDNPSINGLVTWAYALITFQNIVPISLYVSIEFVRTIQAAFIHFDPEMYYEKTDQPALAKSWTLADDLGQIEYIFSDKTGTLTQNSMVFRKCSIGGKTYHGDPLDERSSSETKEPKTEVKNISSSAGSSNFTASASNSPQSSDDSGVPTNPSPLNAKGVKLPEKVIHHFRDQTLSRDLQEAAEYQAWSERYNEATILLENREARIEAVSSELEQDLRLLGATAIEDRLQDGVPETIEDLKRAGIKVWVATGDKLETAIAIGHSTNLIGRDSNIIVVRGGNNRGRSVRNQILHAIEEFFPEESASLEEKSAVDNGGLRSPLAQNATYPLQRTDTGISSIVGAGNGDRPGGFVLVIDGIALEQALKDENKVLLLRLAVLCEGVICCRVSPLQKALVVKLVKDGVGAMTLAIGDGANDVSMIQAAHVGVGIAGEEGLQAVNSSDYAIAQFRFLKRLLLVHGHWSYARNGNMIVNFFYKNIVCIGVLWWFQIYDGWSSNYVFEYTYLLFWNSFWTFFPAIGMGLFDRFVDAHVLMEIPELYRYGRQGSWFGLKLFGIYMFDGVVQSAIIFFVILYAYNSTSARTDGYSVSLYEFSTTMAFSAVIVSNLFNGLNTSAWTVWIFICIFLGIVLLWVYTAIYNIISPGWIVTPVYGNNHFLFESAFFWLCLPLTVCVALAPRYLAKAWKTGFAPDDIDTLRYITKTDPYRDIRHDAFFMSKLSALKRPASVASRTASRTSLDLRMASHTDMSTGIRSTHRGFDFATEEGGVAMRRMQSNLSERRQSSKNLATQGKKKSSEVQQERPRSGTLFGSIRGKLKKKPGSAGSASSTT
ncbi:phospholipid-translocating P-type ATPase [Pluteus cervinus]|uniref:Phospholipid-translocating P-type ATPase n=1 Tax=Pluteus cervinus TaxID=181527 RepID=A0ACD3ABT7_9AGAR|nr:phospholipid-translocating P-type ATPase [Pluteus cervinus]